jgi:hypothetical protein
MLNTAEDLNKAFDLLLDYVHDLARKNCYPSCQCQEESIEVLNRLERLGYEVNHVFCDKHSPCRLRR